MFKKSLDQILYQCRNSEYREDIEIIYNLDSIDLSSILKDNSCNDLSILKEFKNQVGIYIFLNPEEESVYIGMAGEKGRTGNLAKRISSQLVESSHLLKNIIEVETLLGNYKDDFTKRDKRILEQYLSKLLVYPCGTNSIENITKAQNLEILLLSLIQTKYNR